MRHELKLTLWYTFLAILVIALVTVGLTALRGGLLPWQTAVERAVVEESKSFNDSQNTALANYILEHSRLDTKIASTDDAKLINAYESQQGAIVTMMCRQIASMKRVNVDPTTLSWLASKGGCQ